MKQLLFLLLFPCLALAQYTGNAGQKITLGEQTTADGLVFRGVANIDTVTATSKITRANKQDTSAFLLLDTVTNLLWHYKTGSNKWIQAGGGDTTSIAYVNTYGTQTVNGAKTFTSAVTATRFNPTANTATGTGMFAPTSKSLGFSTNGTNKMTLDSAGILGFGVTPGAWAGQINSAIEGKNGGTIAFGFNALPVVYIVSNGIFNGTDFLRKVTGNYAAYAINNNDGSHRFYTAASGSAGSVVVGSEIMRLTANGNVGIGTETVDVQLHTTGAVRFATFAGGGTTTLSVDNTGNLARTSSIELKKDVTPISYGLNEILQINPINFNWIDENKFGNENENGFIAEDVMSIIPNVVASDTHGLFMDYTKLIPILTKAIQEQQALIKALEQRILTLENK